MKDDPLQMITEYDFRKSSSFDGLTLCLFLQEMDFDSDSVQQKRKMWSERSNFKSVHTRYTSPSITNKNFSHEKIIFNFTREDSVFSCKIS